jgi:hypothetical protein
VADIASAKPWQEHPANHHSKVRIATHPAGCRAGVILAPSWEVGRSGLGVFGCGPVMRVSVMGDVRGSGCSWRSVLACHGLLSRWGWYSPQERQGAGHLWVVGNETGTG